ncbi:MAG: biotin/lipoate A/B protein ligase family protein [Spirochaetales bacterium]|jgi:lipoate-protein ligase A
MKAYRLPSLSVLDHLATENVLIETRDSPEALLLFYINSPSVIIGRNQNPWREAAPGTGLPLFRRVSGGGAVYHDEGNLNWSLIVPRPLHSQEAELAMMAAAISAQGFDVVPGPRGGLYCGATSNHEGRKLSGTARRFNAKNVLHHGTLLVNADMKTLRASLGGIETFNDASLPSVSASPINLSALNSAIEMNELIAGISRALTGTAPRSLPLSKVDASRLDKERAALSSPEWIFGTTPPFSVRLSGAHGEKFVLGVEKGRFVAFRNESCGASPESTRLEELSRYIGLSFSLPRLAEMNSIVAAANG